MKDKKQVKTELIATIEQLDIINLLRVFDFARALNNKEKKTNDPL